MTTIFFSEADFYAQQRSIDNKAVLAFCLALGLHAGLFFGSRYMPHLTRPVPVIEDFIDVEFISLEKEEPAPEEPSSGEMSAPPPLDVPRQQPEETGPEAVAVVPDPEPDTELPPPPEVKPVSIRPLRLKKKIAADTRLEEEKIEQRLKRLKQEQQRKARALARKRKEQQRKAEALARAKAAELEAVKAARDARKVAEMYRAQQNNYKGRETRPNDSNSAGSNMQSSLALQYYASVKEHIKRFWQLTESRNWDPGLQAIVSFTINKNGDICNLQIEEKSGDPVFDQLAKKALLDAAPMPAIPGILRKTKVDIGLRFNPGSLGS
ncbi:MAG: hypothetical protein CSA32_00600 [Desulfobulbus propionicus]|nr:MAG: hypothetical protein CSA32_00600 [Desulfobulbus propionicus]